jgi:hypothetical protein
VYLPIFSKDRLLDKNGDKIVDFEADVRAITPRFIWVTPWKLFGASVASQVFFPTYWASVDIGGESGNGGASFDDSGLGDILFTPVVLGWHLGPSLHVVAAEDLFLPTGDYDARDPSSQILSKNQVTFESVVAATYFIGNFDFSVKAMYDFNTKNDDYILGSSAGKVQPGQEFHVDWAVSYAPTEAVRLGISGYSYWQVTKDEFDSDSGGPKVKGDQGQVHALGPAVQYWPNKGRFSATLKHQWEFGAKSLPEGQTSWLNVVWAF